MFYEPIRDYQTGHAIEVWRCPIHCSVTVIPRKLKRTKNKENKEKKNMLSKKIIEQASREVYLCHMNAENRITSSTVRTIRRLIQEHQQLKVLLQEKNT